MGLNFGKFSPDRPSLLGPTTDDEFARSLEPVRTLEALQFSLDLRPGCGSLRVAQPGEHLVERAERLSLETDALGGRGNAQRRGESLTVHISQTGAPKRLLQASRVATAEGTRLAGQRGRQLRPPTDDRDWNRENLLFSGVE